MIASYSFAAWVCAGFGASLLLVRLRWTNLSFVQPTVAALAVAMLALFHAVAQPVAASVDQVAIRRASAPLDLDMVGGYLPFVRDSRAVGFATTFGISDLLLWTLRESCQCHATVDQAPLLNTRTVAEARQIMTEWLSTTQAEIIVFLDAPAPYPLPGVGEIRNRLAGLVAEIEASPRLTRVAGPIHVDQTTIGVWRRNDAAAAPFRPPKRLFLLGGFSALLGAIAIWTLLRHR
jgi:hypothetical protein